MSAPESLAGKTVFVLGAGMVGVCTSLELLKRGAHVTLIDRREPGQETSYGNAGVLARSSLVPLNNPGLLADLPKLMGNRTAALRYNPLFVLKNLNWTLRFLANIRKSSFEETTRSLDGLIRLSIPLHLDLMRQTGMAGHLSDRGWIFLYRSSDRFSRSRLLRQTLEAFNVPTQVLNERDLAGAEPALAPIFRKALWVQDSYSVDDPGAVVGGYAARFRALGGTFHQAELAALEESSDGIDIHLVDGGSISADQVVVCLGPWSKTFLERSDFKVPMAFERGYHRHFTGAANEKGNRSLTRPVYDTGGGYVLSPMAKGLRLTTGVELADCDAPKSDDQLRKAERAAREAIVLGERFEEDSWLGRRPTFPDSRPVIGQAPSSRNIFLAFGHQHIGFATGTGSAAILADLMEAKQPPIDARPFRPERYVSRRNGRTVVTGRIWSPR